MTTADGGPCRETQAPGRWAATQQLCTARACGWKLDGMALTAARQKCSPSSSHRKQSAATHIVVVGGGRWKTRDVFSPRSSSLPRGRWTGAGSARQLQATRDGEHRQEVDWIRVWRRSKILPGSSKEDGRRHEARLDPWVPGSARFEGARIRRDGGVGAAPSRQWSPGSM